MAVLRGRRRAKLGRCCDKVTKTVRTPALGVSFVSFQQLRKGQVGHSGLGQERRLSWRFLPTSLEPFLFSHSQRIA